MKKLFIAISLFLTFLAAGAETYTAPVKVEGGEIRGIVKDGVDMYLGIPFAAPPVGDLRWKEPQPVEHWQGVRLCDRFAPAPMQNMQARHPKVWKNVDEMNPTTSEDCLYLNVFAPEKKGSEPLPVMVWIFGGGFHVGSTDGPVYRGDAYAKKGVILVSIPYRLGIFGYLAHPELSRESGHGSGNYAIYDQIKGLQWVKDNIAAFGGDPDNITVFGQSAGSRSIQGLICSTALNENPGLIKRAIPQSGCAIRDDAKNATLAENEAMGKAFFESIGATNLDAMRAIDAVTLHSKYMSSPWKTKFRPAIDGYLITEDFNDATLGGRYLDIDYMIGYTKDDVPAANFPVSIGRWADNQVDKLGRRDIYVYSFDHPQPEDPNNPTKDEFGAKGAIHSAELPYMFGQVHNSTRPMTKQDYELAERMVTYWTNFAKYGNPNGKNAGEWKPYTKTNHEVFHLDVK